jgi:hypothetical protein
MRDLQPLAACTQATPAIMLITAKRTHHQALFCRQCRSVRWSHQISVTSQSVTRAYGGNKSTLLASDLFMLAGAIIGWEGWLLVVVNHNTALCMLATLAKCLQSCH